MLYKIKLKRLLSFFPPFGTLKSEWGDKIGKLEKPYKNSKQKRTKHENINMKCIEEHIYKISKHIIKVGK